MNIALVGLPTREAAALTIFIGVALKGMSCRTVVFQPGLALPTVGLYVIDMAGIGLAQWSVKAEADLLMLLGGQNALLLLVSTNTSWVDKVVQPHGRQMLNCLTKPYTSEDMRTALTRFNAGIAATTAATTTTPARADSAAVGRPASKPLMSMSPPVPVPVATVSGAVRFPVRSVLKPVVAPSLRDNLQALRTMFPDLGRHLLLARLLEMVSVGRPQELRLTLHHSIVLHPAHGWLAHNVPPSVLERLAQDSNVVATMSVRELDDSQALQRATQAHANPFTRVALDTFLWMLAESSIGQSTPQALCDAELTLTSIPCFTRIPSVGNLFLQLAAICVRLPQTLSSLRAAFPDGCPDDISRFMLLSTVSGLGNLRLVAPTAGIKSLSCPVPLPVRREISGFIRAMLKKLF